MDPNLEIKEPGHDLIIYRVVQELLNNAMKHSQASIVKIALTQQDHSLTIAYEDNGIGMDKIGRACVGKECRSRWSPYH